MLQTVMTPKRAVLLVAALAALCAVFLAGCGNSNDASTQMAAAPTPAAAPHTAASGTAVTAKLSIDQLTLDSPVKLTTDKNGLVFMNFRYTDNDGKVYECVLPKAMGEGQYTINEWVSTFNAYRLPKVIAQKQVKKTVAMNDFPFISPKPQEQPKQEAQPQPKPNFTMPTLPSTPAGPGAPPGGPRTPVSSMPGGPMPPPP